LLKITLPSRATSAEPVKPDSGEKRQGGQNNQTGGESFGLVHNSLFGLET
jgi:hypothetical protein